MIQLREYQVNLSKEGASILRHNGIVYLAMEVRTGKTLVSLTIANIMQAKSVLFVTKKRAMSSIQNDFDAIGYTYNLDIINYESLHKVTDTDYDIIIVDETHSIGAFPKPSLRAKRLKKLFTRGTGMIALSGTPTPESYSQMYHQLWVSPYSPFKDYKNFYSFAKEFVDVQERFLGSIRVKDYSFAYKDLIIPLIQPLMITYSQKQANFKNTIEEIVINIKMNAFTKEYIETLLSDRVLEIRDNGRYDVILGDTGVKLQNKIHQLNSGTVKTEDGVGLIIDRTKAAYIYTYFKGVKIAIFYKFKAELEMLQQIYSQDELTTDIDEFRNTKKSIALQFVSGREGIDLSKADSIVALNIDFSAVTYFQFRDRLTTINRNSATVYWIFAKGGIERKIYAAVKKKKSYTLDYFRTHYRYERASISK